MKNHLFSLCLGYALLAVSIDAMAQQASTEQKQAALERLQSADTNKDGFIDKAEAEAGLPRVAKNFDKLDANDDGKLSPDEFKSMATKFAGRRR